MLGEGRRRTRKLGDNLHDGGFPEGEGLHQLEGVPVVAVDPGEVGLPDLHQLLLGELAGRGGVVVVEPVAVLQPLELVADEALEGRAGQGAVDRHLGDAADEQVNVVNAVVDQLEPLDDLLGDVVGEVVEALDPIEAAELPEGVVAGQAGPFGC